LKQQNLRILAPFPKGVLLLGRDAKGWQRNPQQAEKKHNTNQKCGLFDGVLACQEYQAWYVMMYVLAGQYKNSVFCVHCVACSGSHQMAFCQSQHARHAFEHRHKVQGLCIRHHEISKRPPVFFGTVNPYQS